MSFDDFVIALNPPLTPQLRDALVTLWFDVSQHGGAIGYTPENTVDDVATGVDAYLDKVSAGLAHLIVVLSDERVIACCALVPNAVALQAHFMELKRFMVHPSLQGSGVGEWLVSKACDLAKTDLGIESVHIHVRSGLDLEAFWTRCAFTHVATIPNTVKFADGSYADLLYMQRSLI